MTNKLSRIIDYWNREGLCSNESSTSHSDPDIDYLDNAIENHILKQILDSWAVGRYRCLDIGAGYGRFTKLFRNQYSEVVLLEAAERIYSKLVEFWGKEPGIRCHNCDFESFNDEGKYDLIFTSGVLYLYSDEMVEVFARKAGSMLGENGLFVIRDFISVQKPLVLKSNYVKDGFCYYRTPEFWINFASQLGLEFLLIKRSKPRIYWPRNHYILYITNKLRLKYFYRCKLFINILMHLSNFQMGRKGIQTVFIAMRMQ